jgi:hypothetical protein
VRKRKNERKFAGEKSENTTKAPKTTYLEML